MRRGSDGDIQCKLAAFASPALGNERERVRLEVLEHGHPLQGVPPGSKPGVGVLVACRAQEPRPLSVDLPLPSPR